MNNEKVRATHAIPGRVRLKVPQLKQDPSFGTRIKEQFSAIKAIKQIEVNQVTGSVLVLYDPKEISLPSTLFSLLCSFRNLFPEVDIEQLKTFLTSPADSSATAAGAKDPLAMKICELSSALNERLKKATGADLKTMLPLTLFFLGMHGLLTSESISTPAWYDFIWFSFGAFFMLNPLRS